ncbi:Hypothetical protein CINCED_3A021861 [Cinara cedri]|uniref:Uncharacterized protein n=2 Tax=Cinara cedri TaxID=506608 RepID=A0A5E4MVQ9_9HEMI|nr:Hypothetical protein CINCED_3A021861 [Cinara cedri]
MMLKFVTHKLKTQSLEDHRRSAKLKTIDHDSGTESDDEHSPDREPKITKQSVTKSTRLMENIGNEDMVGDMEPTRSSSSGRSSVATPGPSPYFLDSALPSDCDQHSSEEELEVINSNPEALIQVELPTPDPDEANSCGVPENSVASLARKRCRSASEAGCGNTIAINWSGSSDDEVQGLMSTRPTPLKFCASPPSHVHKPGQCTVSSSPPLKLVHLSPRQSVSLPNTSPRKRHRTRHHLTRNVQRPCLDFEKMQQLKTLSATSWRHTNKDHSGELSVYCW